MTRHLMTLITLWLNGSTKTKTGSSKCYIITLFGSYLSLKVYCTQMKHFEKQRKYLELKNTMSKWTLPTIVSDVGSLFLIFLAPTPLFHHGRVAIAHSALCHPASQPLGMPGLSALPTGFPGRGVNNLILVEIHILGSPYNLVVKFCLVPINSSLIRFIFHYLFNQANLFFFFSNG